MDVISVTAIIASVGSLVLSVITHIKTSSCYMNVVNQNPEVK